MNNNINQYNEQGQLHGYWESYYYTGQLMYKGNYVNDEKEGYWEEYFSDGKLMYKGSFVNDIAQGYFLEYRNNSYYKFFYKNGYRYYKNRYLYDFKTF